MSENTFNIGDYVVYPAHGVGELIRIEEHDICDTVLEFFVIEFNKDHMVLRLPVQKALSAGLRAVAPREEMDEALNSLTTKTRKKKLLWSRRAQEYEAKINSGSLVSLAEVIRELYKEQGDADQSYSERQIYQQALDRFVREMAIVEDINEDEAITRVEEILSAA